MADDPQILLLHTLADDVVQAKEGYLLVGRHLVQFKTLPLLISALLAGWLMALGAWLTVSSPRMGSQMTGVYLVTFLIGIGGLHHSIAGSVEMFAALFSSSAFTVLQGFRFIGLALLGNLLGGSLFVALLNYAHIRRTQTGTTSPWPPGGGASAQRGPVGRAAWPKRAGALLTLARAAFPTKLKVGWGASPTSGVKYKPVGLRPSLRAETLSTLNSQLSTLSNHPLTRVAALRRDASPYAHAPDLPGVAQQVS